MYVSALLVASSNVAVTVTDVSEATTVVAREVCTVKVLSDGWTAVTRDKSLSAQFEHSVGVTEDGVEIFTTSPKGFDKPPYHA